MFMNFLNHEKHQLMKSTHHSKIFVTLVIFILMMINTGASAATLYTYSLTIHTVEIFDDHDSDGDGEIFLKISVNGEERQVYPEIDHYIMTVGEIQSVEETFNFTSNNPISSLEVEVRENDGFSGDDSLGQLDIPLVNITATAVVVSNPGDARITYSLSIEQTKTPVIATETVGSIQSMS